MSQSTLQIQPEPSANALAQQFTLIGVVDVDAIPALESLYILPQSCAVELDFALVQRVNSMGLAQLLKLFEHWQKQKISIRVTHVNRMIGVLFKMTNLTRFLADAGSDTSATQSATPSTPKSASPVISASPVPAPGPVSVANRATAKTGKLNLLVSAQSGQQMNGWYFFNTFLQRRLGREIHMEVAHGAMTDKNLRLEEMDVVFVQPFVATRLILEQHFRPLIRPLEQTDEVTVLVRADDARYQLADFQGGKIVTASADSFVYLLGRFLLDSEGFNSEEMQYLFSGHEVKALQMLLKGQSDVLFMLSESYRGLSSLTKKMVREIDQSETGFAFPLFCISPHSQEFSNAIIDVLLDMARDFQGQQVLTDLGIDGWCRPTKDEINMLTMLYSRYAQAKADSPSQLYA